MKYFFNQLKKLDLKDLPKHLSTIKSILSDIEQHKSSASPAVDKECQILIRDMLNNDTYLKYKKELSDILQQIEQILLREAHKHAFSAIHGFNAQTLKRKEQESKNKKIEHPQDGFYNASMLDKLKSDSVFVQAQEEDEDNDWEELPSISSNLSPVTTQESRSSASSPPVAYTQVKPQQTYVQPGIVPPKALIDQIRQKLGHSNEEIIKESIQQSFTKLLQSNSDEALSYIKQLEKTLNDYKTHIETEEDVNSNYTDNSDDTDSEHCESVIFEEKARKFIANLLEAAANNQHFGQHIRTFIEDKENPLKIKFNVIEIRKLPLAAPFAVQLQNITRNYATHEHSKPEHLILNTAVHTAQQATTSMQISPQNTVKHAANKSLMKPKKIKQLTMLDMPVTKPCLDDTTYQQQFSEIVQIKKQIKALIDNPQKNLTAQEAKRLVESYFYKIYSLKLEHLNAGQRKNFDNYDKSNFNQKAQQFSNDLNSIITKEQEKVVLKNNERKILLGEFKVAAGDILKCNVLSDNTLRYYYGKKSALLHILKSLDKEPKPKLKELIQQVEEHIQSLKKQHKNQFAKTKKHLPLNTQSLDIEPAREEAIQEQRKLAPTRNALDDTTLHTILVRSEKLAHEFDKKVKQLKENPKWIQYGTHDNKFDVAYMAAERLQDKLKLARERLSQTRNIKQYQIDVQTAFSDPWTQEVFATNRTTPWLRPISKLIDAFKRMMNQVFTSSNMLGTLFSPFKVGTETSQKAQEYEQELQKLSRQAPKGS